MTAGHSHFDVMTKYWKLQGWGEYQTEHREDHEPYPDEWVLLSTVCELQIDCDDHSVAWR